MEEMKILGGIGGEKIWEEYVEEFIHTIGVPKMWEVADELVKDAINQIDIVRKKDGSPLFASKSVNGQPVTSLIIRFPGETVNRHVDGKELTKFRVCRIILGVVLPKMWEASYAMYEEELLRTRVSLTDYEIKSKVDDFRRSVLYYSSEEIRRDEVLASLVVHSSKNVWDLIMLRYKHRIQELFASIPASDLAPSKKAMQMADRNLRKQIQKFLHDNLMIIEAFDGVEKEIQKLEMKRMMK